jgi:hypothetical protein
MNLAAGTGLNVIVFHEIVSYLRICQMRPQIELSRCTDLIRLIKQESERMMRKLFAGAVKVACERVGTYVPTQALATERTQLATMMLCQRH